MRANRAVQWAVMEPETLVGVDQEWIERTLMPRLEDVAQREWSAETLQALVSELSEQISAAVRDGRLTRDGAKLARTRITDAMRTIPGGDAMLPNREDA